MDQFNLEIISPEKSFLTKSDTEEVVIPAIEGYMGILKDHIPLISFLKPGIIDVKSKNETLNYEWFSAMGEVTIGETSNLATWTAPMEPGLYSISCSVSDESYGLDIATIEITVE